MARDQDRSEACRVVGSDECVLARVLPLIPVRTVADKVYLRKPGAGRPPKPARLVFEAIIYVLRTGRQRKESHGAGRVSMAR